MTEEKKISEDAKKHAHSESIRTEHKYTEHKITEPQQSSGIDSNTRYMFFVLIALLLILGGIIGLRYWYEPAQEETGYIYNGFTFTNVTGLWYTQLQKEETGVLYNVPLHFGPRELETVSLQGNALSFLNNSKMYITFDPIGSSFEYVALSASELSINLAQTFNITPVGACTTNETKACSDRPIVRCGKTKDATIYLRQSNETGVIVDGNCVIVQGRGKNLVRATDRLLLHLFRVMK